MERSIWPTPRPMWSVSQMYDAGWTKDTLRTCGCERIGRGAYLDGTDPTPFELLLAPAVAAGGVVRGRVAATLHRIDGFLALPGLPATGPVGPELLLPQWSSNHRPGVSRASLRDDEIVEVHGVRCTNPARTLVDLAGVLSAARWELALESVLRSGTTADEVLVAVAGLRARRARGLRVIEAVLAVRPLDLPATGSVMETLFLQLLRRAGVPMPDRQVLVVTATGDFVAYVDTAWRDVGVFFELDGEGHDGQPTYDADRQTRVAAATGWLCGRLRWRHVVFLQRVTVGRVRGVLEQAGRRPLAA